MPLAQSDKPPSQTRFGPVSSADLGSTRQSKRGWRLLGCLCRWTGCDCSRTWEDHRQAGAWRCHPESNCRSLTADPRV